MKKTILILSLMILPLLASAELFENIVIKVNNKIVNRYELDRFKAIIKATMNKQDITDTQAKKQLMQILVLEYFTEENSIEISEKDVNREIVEIAERMKLSGEKQIREVLATQFKVIISADDLKDFIRKQLVFKKSQEFLILNKKRSDIKQPSEKEVVDFYNKNKQHFLAPSEIKLAHLVILASNNLSFKEQLAIEKKLQSIRSECLRVKDLKKREELFYTKVENEASAIYKKNRGFLGEFDQEKLRALFPQYLKAFELKKGDITDIIGSEYGRHIVLVIDKKGGEYIDIAKLKQRIEQILMMQQGEKIFADWIEDYSKKFQITVN